MNKSDIFWQTYLNLEKEAIELSRYIFFTDEIIKNSSAGLITENWDSHLKTFSPYIADLLVRCCVQIEAIAKELYFKIGGTKQRGASNLFFDEDCLKKIDIKWATSKKRVLVVSTSFDFKKDKNRILRPLKDAHKRQGTTWEIAYQAVKHDRYSSLYLGNIKNFIHALAALYLLNIYYRNESWFVKCKDIFELDYSLGSSIFAVKPPSTDKLWYGNNSDVSDSESPFNVQYEEDIYKRIEDMRVKYDKELLNEYWRMQPELQEQEFLDQLKAATEKEKADPSSRVMYLQELGKYRLNKKAPSTLSFDERKQILINSEEWNGKVHQNMEHLKAEELTVENIQEEIDNAGIHGGLELAKQFQSREWLPFAMNSTCKVFIPESI